MMSSSDCSKAVWMRPLLDQVPHSASLVKSCSEKRPPDPFREPCVWLEGGLRTDPSSCRFCRVTLRWDAMPPETAAVRNRADSGKKAGRFAQDCLGIVASANDGGGSVNHNRPSEKTLWEAAKHAGKTWRIPPRSRLVGGDLPQGGTPGALGHAGRIRAEQSVGLA